MKPDARTNIFIVDNVASDDKSDIVQVDKTLVEELDVSVHAIQFVNP